MTSRARQAPWSWRRHQLLHSSETLLVERAEILSKTGGKDCKVIFLWPYFYAVLVFFAKMLQLEKSFSLLFITDLNTASLVKSLWTLHITYLICISNAQVLTKSVKIDQSESIPDPGYSGILGIYRNDLLLRLPTGILLLPLAALFLVFRALFSALRLD